MRQLRIIAIVVAFGLPASLALTVSVAFFDKANVGIDYIHTGAITPKIGEEFDKARFNKTVRNVKLVIPPRYLTQQIRQPVLLPIVR